MSFPPLSVALLSADAPGVLTQYPPLWGIFWQSGAPALVADSVGSVEYKRGYDISDYPQEQGAWASYNKVQKPFDSKVTLLSSLTRQQLLNILEPTVASLAFVSVVTPEVSYPSANLTDYAIRPRTSRSGVSLVTVDVWVKEVRVTATTALGGTARPVGQVSGGSSLVPSTPSGANPTAPPVSGSLDVASSSGSNSVDLATGQGQFAVPNNSSVLDTGSTNAATPTQSGPVQGNSPADSSGVSIESISISPPLSPPT